MKINLICFSVLFLALMRRSESVYKFSRYSPVYAQFKPTSAPSVQTAVDNVVQCARVCYRNDDCSGYFYNDVNGGCSVYNRSFYEMNFVTDTAQEAYETPRLVNSDCYDVMMSGDATSGIYKIVPRDNGGPITVFCELTVNDGGWLVIQRRADGSEDFYRTWNEYRDGFGNLTNEFWLGNTNIHRVTGGGVYELRVDLEDFEGNSVYALYKHFSIANETEFFKLSLGEYSGTAGDSLGGHRGHNFTTKDKDLDTWYANCAQQFKGAWWYQDCHSSNLNGLYLRGNHSSYADGVDWLSFRGYYYSVKTSVMKIRPSPLV